MRPPRVARRLPTTHPGRRSPALDGVRRCPLGKVAQRSRVLPRRGRFVMRRSTALGVLSFALTVATACSEPVQPPAPKAVAPQDTAQPILFSLFDGDPLSGVFTTVFDAGPGAFGHPAPNLDATGLARHESGDEGFSRVFDPSTGLSPR